MDYSPSSTAPISIESHPTDQKLVNSYLKPWAEDGQKTTGAFIHEADVYAEDPAELTKKFPAAVEQGDGKHAWYFFTELRHKSVNSKRIARTAGSEGCCWHGENTSPVNMVVDKKKKQIGVLGKFSFLRPGTPKSIRSGWIMDELTLHYDGGEAQGASANKNHALCKVYYTPRTPKPQPSGIEPAAAAAAAAHAHSAKADEPAAAAAAPAQMAQAHQDYDEPVPAAATQRAQADQDYDEPVAAAAPAQRAKADQGDGPVVAKAPPAQRVKADKDDEPVAVAAPSQRAKADQGDEPAAAAAPAQRSKKAGQGDEPAAAAAPAQRSKKADQGDEPVVAKAPPAQRAKADQHDEPCAATAAEVGVMAPEKEACDLDHIANIMKSIAHGAQPEPVTSPSVGSPLAKKQSQTHGAVHEKKAIDARVAATTGLNWWLEQVESDDFDDLLDFIFDESEDEVKKRLWKKVESEEELWKKVVPLASINEKYAHQPLPTKKIRSVSQNVSKSAAAWQRVKLPSPKAPMQIGIEQRPQENEVEVEEPVQTKCCQSLRLNPNNFTPAVTTKETEIAATTTWNEHVDFYDKIKKHFDGIRKVCSDLNADQDSLVAELKMERQQHKKTKSTLEAVYRETKQLAQTKLPNVVDQLISITKEVKEIGGSSPQTPSTEPILQNKTLEEAALKHHIIAPQKTISTPIITKATKRASCNISAVGVDDDEIKKLLDGIHKLKADRDRLEAELKMERKEHKKTKAVLEVASREKQLSQTRLSNVEDRLARVTMEVKEIKDLFPTNIQSTAKAADFQESSTLGDVKSELLTAQRNGPRPQNPTRIPNTKPILQNKTLEEATPKQHIAPQKTISHDDYSLTQEDDEVAHFIKNSFHNAKVVEIDGHALTVGMLRPIVMRGFIYDDVINAYAIGNVETDWKSVLTTYQVRKLIGENGPIFYDSKEMQFVAKKCVGRSMVFAPMNIFNNHWVLIVLNFNKKEIQVLNSLAGDCNCRDVAKEHALVKSLKNCIVVRAGHDVDGITAWNTECYYNIPQQEDSYSCGAFILKYMLAWNGEKMTEEFDQEKINIFSRKICSKLLFSQRNKLQMESYKEPLTKEEYFKQDRPGQSNAMTDDDDIKEISNSDYAIKPKNSDSKKRKGQRSTNIEEDVCKNLAPGRVKKKKSRRVSDL